MTTGYDVHSYGRMVEDTVRMSAYREALIRHVKPGSVVVELGAGPGVMAMLACQLGAAKVYAIEPDPSIELLRRFAKQNGFADRIVCIPKMSTEVDLPELGDVLLSDLRGTIPLHQTHIPSIRDARLRLLKPGGKQLPQRDRLMVGLSRDDVQYVALQRPWRHNDFGLKLDAGRGYGMNTWRSANVPSMVSVGEPKQWAEIDYRTVESPDVAGSVELAGEAGERINGLQVWFEAEVCDGIGYSTGPDQPEQVYGRLWLPLEEEVTFEAGETARVELDMRLISGAYVSRWSTLVGRPGAPRPRVQMRQSTLGSLLMSPADLVRLSLSYAPTLGGRSEVARYVLERFDGKNTVSNIARQAAAAFPAELRHEQDAIELVRDLAARYSPNP